MLSSSGGNSRADMRQHQSWLTVSQLSSCKPYQALQLMSCNDCLPLAQETSPKGNYFLGASTR